MSFLESAPVTAKDLLVVREGLETKLSGKQDVLSTAAGTLDATPQAGSTRPLTSGAVHSSIATLTSQLSGKLSTSGGTLTGGIAISGFANGIACGGATPESGNVVTTGACNAAGGYSASNGGLHVANDITTTGGSVVTNTIKANSGTTVSVHTGHTLSAPTLSASTVNATTVNPTTITNCSFLNGQGITQGGGLLLRNDRTFNPNQVNGDVVIKSNTISDSDTGGLEGMARSRVFIQQRYRRNAGGHTYNENTAVFYATTAGDNNGRRVHFRTRGNMQANNTQLLSDDRLKFDEVDITGATATVMKLKPQIYRKYETINSDGTRPDGSGVLEIGLIAQDVESIDELAHTVSLSAPLLDDDEVPIKTLSYTDIFCVHLKAFQEQQHIIEALLARIEALETK